MRKVKWEIKRGWFNVIEKYRCEFGEIEIENHCISGNTYSRDYLVRDNGKTHKFKYLADAKSFVLGERNRFDGFHYVVE